MEKIMKKIISAILVVAITICALALLSSCNNTKKTAADKIAAGETLKIGVIQYMSHPSLDNCYNGIAAAFEESGIKYEIDRQTGSTNSADSDCTNFAKNMVASNYDIIFAIATPAAQAAYAATADTEIPVVFCAVSDPESSGLVKSNDAPGELCTGTSDVLDLEAQVNLISAIQPDVKKIGIIYTSSEDNSVSNLARLREICAARNITVVAKAVQNASDIPSVANDVASQVDCINNFTDNNVVNNLSVVLAAAETYGIPVYGSEVEQVKNGCLASVSIEYVALGKETGRMGIDILKGADASKMAVRTISDATPVFNETVGNALNISVPDGYSTIEIVKTVD